jgi:hypothetical protein
MGHAGRERVGVFTASHVIRRIESIYGRLAGAAA